MILLSQVVLESNLEGGSHLQNYLLEQFSNPLGLGDFHEKFHSLIFEGLEVEKV